MTQKNPRHKSAKTEYTVLIQGSHTASLQSVYTTLLQEAAGSGQPSPVHPQTQS